jgi:DNA-binding GntR family transcriptional regulator
LAVTSIKLRPVRMSTALKDQVYHALKSAITSMDIYAGGEAAKLDERRLAEDLGVSRTPIREALSRLEQEGLVETIPRKGAFVVRKTKAEILEMVYAWAALESMAARLATERASDEEIGRLRELFGTFAAPDKATAQIDEYSDTNIRFHQSIMALSKNSVLQSLAETLFVHMRAIRAQTITERDRASRSVIDHMHIIEAIEHRDTELAERLVREHTFGLAEHINDYVAYLD